MKFNSNHILSSIAKTTVLAMLFYCCTPKEKEGKAINFQEVAQGIGYEVVVKHTDSGRLTAILVSPVLKDFTHVDFPHYEFPKGVELTIYDKKGGESKVFADYAIQYEKTKMVDLQGNVRIVTSDSSVLNAPQLYWNQQLHWVYTDKDYDVRFKNGAKNKGSGFDANEDFTNFKSRSNVGTQILED